MTRSPLILAVLLAGLTAGCTNAFVYKKNEFNRNDPNFNKPLTDRNDVAICFRGFGTSDGHVARLAQEECSRVGKIAVADGETFGECPLFTPLAARFLCLAPLPEPSAAADAAAAPSTPETAPDHEKF